jgi:hypothetical protein
VLDEHWDYLWSANYPTQAEVDATMSSEAQRQEAQRRAELIAEWRQRYPGATKSDAIAWEMVLLEQHFGRKGGEAPLAAMVLDVRNAPTSTVAPTVSDAAPSSSPPGGGAAHGLFVVDIPREARGAVIMRARW